MKKLLCFMLCILACFMCACSVLRGRDNTPVGETDAMDVSSNKDCSDSTGIDTDNMNVLDSGDYYTLYQNRDTSLLYYRIYDKNGNTVLEEGQETYRPMNITMVRDSVVDISVGYGTGIQGHRYYNAADNELSREYMYVIAATGVLVAYIDVPQENTFDGRKVVVQNIFDEDVYRKELKLDFSKTVMPIDKAEFSDDGTSLAVTYLTGEDMKPVSTVLPLGK